jgi:hypothetical protein
MRRGNFGGGGVGPFRGNRGGAPAGRGGGGRGRQPRQVPWGPIFDDRGNLLLIQNWIVVIRYDATTHHAVHRAYPPIPQTILTTPVIHGAHVTFVAGQWEAGLAPGLDRRGVRRNGEHFQGYMVFSQRVSAASILAFLLDLLGHAGWQGLTADNFWMSPRYGSHADALAYVQKEETRLYLGARRVAQGRAAEMFHNNFDPADTEGQKPVPERQQPLPMMMMNGQYDNAEDEDIEEFAEEEHRMAHKLRPVRGDSFKENLEVATLMGIYYEFGTPPNPSATDVWDIAHDIIVNQKGDESAFLEDVQRFKIFARYGNGLGKLIQTVKNNDVVADNPRDIRVIVYYGDAGTGKSGAVRRWAEDNEEKIFTKPIEKSSFYTGYDKENVLLLEEFGNKDAASRANMMPLQEFQRALDIYPFTLKVMYGQAKARWHYVFITSNIPPTQWYDVPAASQESVQRRIHEIWRFTKTAVYLEKGTGEFAPSPDPSVNPPPNVIYHQEVTEPAVDPPEVPVILPSHPKATRIEIDPATMKVLERISRNPFSSF